MVRKFLQDVRSFLASNFCYALLFAWIIGSVTGSWLGFQLVPDYRTPQSYISIDHKEVLTRSVFLASSLGISILLNHFRFHIGLIFLGCIKSILYSYSVTFILLCFSQAGWLMLTLLMLSDFIFTASFLYYCFFCEAWSIDIRHKRLSLLIFICFLALLFDVFFISPTLDTLIYKI